ncbi:lytic transglycosylase domain-containing protein [Saccharopolyspora mangrovi]|uniref:Lytic murein transglycosylase n=1 Tax=Saccharopolyspora mangrovi TaxID=3082379 RepID=A0ABU6A3R1_9PSEU|nr:lytic murein transglycosylase [Saccharopolyspora sp. S2-29]MEB3366121.1 lytic murein transglycosylase [Saccharopolyspora sp. S2-29]
MRDRRLLALPLLLALAACSPQPTTTFELPSASAPPDPGIDPPPVELLAEGARSPERPQAQLTDWSERMSDRLNIPRAALQAYGYAQLTMDAGAAGCGLSWTVLAGIGAVESSHGRHGGSRLDETGRPNPRIIGLPLDGSAGVKQIHDTDGGALDGDPVWDRAVGPLQFIPSTWRKYQSDADGDGVADPQDLDDAALTAGRYLCAVGHDMRDGDRFWAALLDYNQSRSYGQEVLDYADHYGRTSRSLPAEG